MKATTNFDLTANHELAISAIVGNMTSAVVPEQWNFRRDSAHQGCFIADNLDTGRVE